MDLHLCLTTAMADILDEEEVLVCCRLQPIQSAFTAGVGGTKLRRPSRPR